MPRHIYCTSVEASHIPPEKLIAYAYIINNKLNNTIINDKLTAYRGYSICCGRG